MKYIFCLLIPFILSAKPTGIERLVDGNKRFVSGDLEHPNLSAERRKDVAGGQNPFGVIVCCSDSRLPPELIFDQGLGDLFVVRVAGNVIGSLALESIEYAVVHLKASTVLVMGHSECGAVKAVLEGVTQDIPDIAFLMEPAIKPGELDASIKANAIRMANFVKSRSFIQDNHAEVYAGYYDLKSGELILLEKNPTKEVPAIPLSVK